MIPVFTIFFVIVILITAATIKHNTKEQDSVDSRFWERERKANSTLKKDISNLKYITIPDEFFPSESDALSLIHISSPRDRTRSRMPSSA